MDVTLPPMTREELSEIETTLMGSNEPAPFVATGHHFANGVYGREMYMPEGAVVVGKIHRYEAINVITMGQVVVANPEQPEMNKILVAPFTYVSPAGTKRLIMALKDSIWMTFHPANSQDLAELEDDLIVKNYDELTLEEREALGGGQ